MMIIDTSAELLSAFSQEGFDIEKWKAYMDALVPGAKELCLRDAEEVISAGYSWEECFLPILNAVKSNEEKRTQAVRSFREVTADLDSRLTAVFGRSVEADLVLYLGLGNGAGWVTEVNGRRTVLFGIEKIIELDWCSPADMRGLVYHELGHVYHFEHGVLCTEFPQRRDEFIWQLFEEGIAMAFEQEMVGDPDYFHENYPGWQGWCGEHLADIAAGFAGDLDGMTHENQRFFGDWVRFEGQPDTGYYLGARFIRSLMASDSFDRIIRYSLPEIKKALYDYLNSFN